jgi:hypothetical protein
MSEESFKKSLKRAGQAGQTVNQANDSRKSRDLETRLQRLEQELVALRAEMDYIRAKQSD